jgi:hypothetical protein
MFTRGSSVCDKQAFKLRCRPGAPGFTCHVERTPTASGPWTSLSAVTAGTHGQGQYEDTNPLPDGRYYRAVYP